LVHKKIIKEFNDIRFNEVLPVYYDYEDISEEKNKLNDMAIKSMRILLQSNMNENSTWTFLMLADLFDEGAKDVFAR